MKAWGIYHDMLQEGDRIHKRATEVYAVYGLARGGINIAALRHILKPSLVYIKPLSQSKLRSRLLGTLVSSLNC